MRLSTPIRYADLTTIGVSLESAKSRRLAEPVRMLMDETSISAPLSQTIARSSTVQSTALAYLAISLAIAGTVVWGFWPSYFGPLLAGSVTRPWFIHAHATVFLGWVALLIAQASLL